MQLGSAEVLQDLLPIRGVVIATQVRLQLATENFECCTLANTVGSNKTEDLAGTGHRQTVELETVGRVAMGDLAFQVGGQVDDVDGAEWAFLRANTATDAKAFRDEGDLRVGGNLNAKLACANHRTRLLAFLATFLLQS